MAQLGYSSGDHLTDRCFAYCSALRSFYALNWFVCAFTVRDVCDADHLFSDGKSAWAWVNGPYLIQTYMNGDWGRSGWTPRCGMNSFTRSEPATSYEDCGCSDTYGYLKVTNPNCISCTQDQEPCVMNRADYAQLCPWTMALIGWRDANGDGIYDPLNMTTAEKRPLGMSTYTLAPGDWVEIRDGFGSPQKEIDVSEWNSAPPYGRVIWDGTDFQGTTLSMGHYYYRKNGMGDYQDAVLAGDDAPPECLDVTVSTDRRMPGLTL